jgi:hypothetical protein
MISAYFFVGRIKSSKAGFTNLEYCIKTDVYQHNANRNATYTLRKLARKCKVIHPTSYKWRSNERELSIHKQTKKNIYVNII